MRGLLLSTLLIIVCLGNTFAQKSKWVRKAEQAIAKEDYKSAVSYLSRAIRQEESFDASLYFLRAESYLKLGKRDKAASDLYQSIQKNPHEAEAFRIRGELYAKNHEYFKSKKDLERYLDIKAKSRKDWRPKPTALYFLGFSHYHLGNLEKAKKLINDYLRLGDITERRGALLIRGMLESYGQQEEAALRNFRLAVRDFPKDHELLFEQARVHLQFGQSSRGEDILRQVALLPAKSSEAYIWRSYAKLLLKDRNGALKDLKEGMRSPKAEHYYLSAKFHAIALDPEACVEQLEAALKKGFHDFGRLGIDADFRRLAGSPVYQKFYADNQLFLKSGGNGSVQERIKAYVTHKIEAWQLKGEFEKLSDYQRRVNEASRQQMVSKLTREAANILIDEHKSLATLNDFELDKYDTENETFLLYSDQHGDLILPVPIALAKDFKKHFETLEYRDPRYILTEDGFRLSYLEVISDKLKKSFVYNQDEKVSYGIYNIDYDFEEVDILLEKNFGSQIKKVSLNLGTSDVDQNIPKTKQQRPNAVAIVIGNALYSKTKNVDFAINDARSVKSYLISALGFKEGNVLVFENASKGELETVFGSADNPRGRLFNLVKPGLTEVFVYYSGHGAPGLKSKQGYFVPVECDPNYVEIGGYPLDVFYRNLASLDAAKTTVVLDACFSGADILRNISPIGIPIKRTEHTLSNASIFSSSSITQVSSWYNEKYHGLFTYYFLKAIQDHKTTDRDGNGSLSPEEIFLYLSDSNEGVPYKARLLHGLEQTPTFSSSVADKDWILELK